jgi:fumarate hydratase class I
MSKPFVWQELFVQSNDSTEYELLSNQHVTVTELDGGSYQGCTGSVNLVSTAGVYEASFSCAPDI